MYVKIFKINRNVAIYTFFQLLNQQSDALNSITLNALEGFLFYYDTIYWYFLVSFIDEPVVYRLNYFFIVPTTCIFFDEPITFFSNEAVSLCLLLTHVETVIRGTQYFAATSLFDIPFSKSSKALSFSAKNQFVSFRSTRVIFTTWYYFVYNKSNETFELSDFRISRNVLTKVGDNERKSSKGPKILFDQPRYSRYRDLDYREFFLPNIVRNDQ